MSSAKGVQGTVASGFERVRDAFAENFEQRGEVGAAFSLYRGGEMVVDLWGGVADPTTGRAWAQNSLQSVASTTKGATAICALLLAERGELDIDAPVARYWPEFAAAGKQDIPVRWLLTHQVGLPLFDNPLTVEEALAWDPAVEALATQRPVWKPGTAHGYHAITYGWLVGEVVRRITGRSLGTFFAEHVADPLGLDFWIGLPESEHARVCPMLGEEVEDVDLDSLPESMREVMAQFEDPDSLQSRASNITTTPLPVDTPAFYEAEFPAANGVTDARSLARMYASVIGNGVDGVRLLNDETIRLATTEQCVGRDRVIFANTRFGLGFALHRGPVDLVNEGAFGHGGAGGSLGFADPVADIGFGYVMNKMQPYLEDPRPAALIAAVHESLGSEA